MKNYIYLGLAVVLGLVGSSMLKICDGFTVPGPTLIFAVSYTSAFYFFSLALKVIPLSIGYATWSGLSTALNALIGFVFFHETIAPGSIIALALVILGIIIINGAKETTGAEAKAVPQKAPLMQRAHLKAKISK